MFPDKATTTDIRRGCNVNLF